MGNWVARLPGRGFVAHLGVLAVAVLAVYAAVGPVVFWVRGPASAGAAAAAAALCLLGAALALAASAAFRDPSHTVHAVWLGMLLRMAIPLLVVLAIGLGGSRAAEADLLVYLVVFYPVTLATQTVLSVARRRSQDRGGPP